jgi:hypothetical protein
MRRVVRVLTISLAFSLILATSGTAFAAGTKGPRQSRAQQQKAKKNQAKARKATQRARQRTPRARAN